MEYNIITIEKNCHYFVEAVANRKSSKKPSDKRGEHTISLEAIC